MGGTEQGGGRNGPKSKEEREIGEKCREEGENEILIVGDIDEKVKIMDFLKLASWSTLQSPWASWDSIGQAMESNFDASQVTSFKTWGRQSQHMTPALSLNGSYLSCRASL